MSSFQEDELKYSSCIGKELKYNFEKTPFFLFIMIYEVLFSFSGFDMYLYWVRQKVL
jgi:hypothetical protein